MLYIYKYYNYSFITPIKTEFWNEFLDSYFIQNGTSEMIYEFLGSLTKCLEYAEVNLMWIQKSFQTHILKCLEYDEMEPKWI